MSYSLNSELSRLDVGAHDRLYIDLFDYNKVKVWKDSENNDFGGVIKKIILLAWGQFNLIEVASKIDSQVQTVSPDENVFNRLSSLKDYLESNHKSEQKIAVVNNLMDKFSFKDDFLNSVLKEEKEQWLKDKSLNEFPIDSKSFDFDVMRFKSREKIKSEFRSKADKQFASRKKDLLEYINSELKKLRETNEDVRKLGTRYSAYDDAMINSFIRSNLSDEQAFKIVKDRLLSVCKQRQQGSASSGGMTKV